MNEWCIEFVTTLYKSIPFLEPFAELVHYFLGAPGEYGKFSYNNDYILPELFQFSLFSWLNPSASIERQLPDTLPFSWLRILICKLCLLPFIAIFTDWLVKISYPVIMAQHGQSSGYCLVIVFIVVLLLLSTWPVGMRKSPLFVVAWAFLYKLPEEIINILFTGSVCYGIYIYLVLGLHDRIIYPIILLIVGLTFFDWVFHHVRHALVRFFKA